jgi:hypothetical protein
VDARNSGKQSRSGYDTAFGMNHNQHRKPERQTRTTTALTRHPRLGCCRSGLPFWFVVLVGRIYSQTKTSVANAWRPEVHRQYQRAVSSAALVRVPESSGIRRFVA